MSNSMSGPAGKFLFGLLLGATAGAATAILTTRYSGQETRARLEEQALSAKHALEHSMEDMKEKTLSQLQVVKDKTAKLAHQAGDAINDLVPREAQIKMIGQISDKVKTALTDHNSHA